MPQCPTLVIAGTHSGSGKTSFAIALTRALTRRGLRVQTFKVGPDFLDPTYLALASGRPCYNLDGWMAGREYVRRLFARVAADADIAVIEGVMGLFDGADTTTDEGSTAEIARWLDVPILLIVNAHGMGRSIAPLVKGFTTFAAGLRFHGVVANRCGSERHVAWLTDSLCASGLPPLVAAIPRGAFPELASRHLGLITADMGCLPEALLDALANALEGRLNIEGLFPDLSAVGAAPSVFRGSHAGRAAAHQSSAAKREVVPHLAAEAPECQSSQGRPFPEKDEADRIERGATSATIGTVAQTRPDVGLKIGIARDAAFHFYYEDLFDVLAAAGCETLFFSPLSDRRLPEGISGIYLGGGYPESHAEALAANVEMLAAIRAHAAGGKPLYAECGGLMYLSQGLAVDGRLYPFLGLLPARTKMLPAKKALGYVEITLTGDSLWGRAGEVFRGHEFHYSELIDDPAADPEWQTVYALRRRRSEAVEAEGFQKGSILASYTHLAYAARPDSVTYFLNRCGGLP